MASILRGRRFASPKNGFDPPWQAFWISKKRLPFAMPGIWISKKRLRSSMAGVLDLKKTASNFQACRAFGSRKHRLPFSMPGIFDLQRTSSVLPHASCFQSPEEKRARLKLYGMFCWSRCRLIDVMLSSLCAETPMPSEMLKKGIIKSCFSW